MEDSKIYIEHGQIKKKEYLGKTMKKLGGFGMVEQDDFSYETMGVTFDKVEDVISKLIDPNFAYTRSKNYGIAIYHKDSDSPTGVSQVGGCPHEMEQVVSMVAGTGSLSPTEDLRTAKA